MTTTQTHTDLVPRALWTRTVRRLCIMDTRVMSPEDRVRYAARFEAACNARRGSE